jgi:hypothetical protein
LIYDGDLSSPQGDAEDWIAFRPDGSFVFVSLECKGSDAISVEMTENSLPMDTPIRCGDRMKRVPVNPDSDHLVHLQADPASETLRYTNYILTIKTRP